MSRREWDSGGGQRAVRAVSMRVSRLFLRAGTTGSIRNRAPRIEQGIAGAPVGAEIKPGEQKKPDLRGEIGFRMSRNYLPASPVA
jgi:hypothetical protein